MNTPETNKENRDQHGHLINSDGSMCFDSNCSFYEADKEEKCNCEEKSNCCDAEIHYHPADENKAFPICNRCKCNARRADKSSHDRYESMKKENSTPLHTIREEWVDYKNKVGKYILPDDTYTANWWLSKLESYGASIREEGRHDAYEQITEIDKELSSITSQSQKTYEWYEKLADTVLKAPFTRIAIIHGLKSMHEHVEKKTSVKFREELREKIEKKEYRFLDCASGDKDKSGIYIHKDDILSLLPPKS